jgi:DNA-directed RNA polymerase subunit H (RpoH/RPB5)
METTSLGHILIESRKTILDLLELPHRGYDGSQYRKMLGPELNKFANTPEALRMVLKHKSDPTKEAIVEYVFTNIKPAVGSGDFVRRLLEEPAESVSKAQRATMLHSLNPDTTEVIVVYMSKSHGEDTESYDKGALEAWSKYKFRIQFFHMPRLVSNPMKHMLQPKFEVVPHEEHAAILKEWYCRSKAQFPIIKFHNDMVARCLGIVPLDIVKITGASPTAGEYVKYRVCAP